MPRHARYAMLSKKDETRESKQKRGEVNWWNYKQEGESSNRVLWKCRKEGNNGGRTASRQDCCSRQAQRSQTRKRKKDQALGGGGSVVRFKEREGQEQTEDLREMS